MGTSSIKSNISREDFEYSEEVIGKLSAYFENKVVGQKHLKSSLIAAIISDGHILVESVPGLAKTTAAKAISDAVDGKFSRIQCTPDLWPVGPDGTMYAYPVQAEAVLYTDLYNEDDDNDKK